MQKEIIAFNIAFYLITFILIMLGKQDPSLSLGYAIGIIAFWIISTLFLFSLLAKRIIRLESLADKIGVFLGTPVMAIAVAQLLRLSNA